MTMWGLAWGHRLIGVSPVAKLAAMRFGDACDSEGRGAVELDVLVEWCCATEDEVILALAMLSDRVGVRWTNAGGDISFELPVEAWPTRRSPPKHEPELSLYVISGSRGTKIGISRDVEKRVESLGISLMEDGLKVHWSARGPASKIRRVERAVHVALATHNVRGEWFSVSVEAAIIAVQTHMATDE
jgi:hypothetical protein